ncbi:HK97-gp10 family putative phage morphogenesis protein [Ligilactobacillus salivarius]|uniref:HK97-gp10 family putative phage morphogenesis protein n=1 Tax=Ligilactobacillus salivarius TaxID=1624 RepID=UPI002480A02E|nr:HK97-gp10 family putative phage morphogenesis protein [Ligilactobacillus salivarius]WGT60841.1 HK97 gp10 family phage protein [Ligilactobacillus salivarius]
MPKIVGIGGVLMSFSIDDNITSELQKLGNKAKRISNKAVRESAPIFAEELKAQTPYENVSDRSWKAQRQMDKKTGKKSEFKHMRDDIQLSGIDQYGHVNVGFGEDTYWRVHFIELGTVNQKPNPFIERTVEETKDDYLNKMSSIIRSELGL